MGLMTLTEAKKEVPTPSDDEIIVQGAVKMRNRLGDACRKLEGVIEGDVELTADEAALIDRARAACTVAR
jgi:hypothetical protein